MTWDYSKTPTNLALFSSLLWLQTAFEVFRLLLLLLHSFDLNIQVDVRVTDAPYKISPSCVLAALWFVCTANNTSAVTSAAVPPPHDFAVTCHEEFKCSLSPFGKSNWPVFGSRQVSPSISRQTLSPGSRQDQGVAKAWRAPLQGCLLLSARIVNPLSEYEIIHQTLRISGIPPSC